ncbi:MAG: phosphonate metabolism protein/1,5-bisphosphokinase (PRPP-forming) PhnN [Hyphomicrobiaceae bacterium]|nr:phosphonate metabolism protein/1,5-bisphosphokinase (PRPP-forming) PhnN [Hyphomicrobiaceae bacterium]
MTAGHASTASVSSGCLILVVGPSGAGKDSLINKARELFSGDPRFHFPKRIITRAPDETEYHEPVSREEFARRINADAFLLHWHANGLSYAIPADAVKHLAQGQYVVANVSRTIISDAFGDFGNLRVVHVTADSDVLSERLEARGREAAGDRTARLDRNARIELPENCPIDEIANNGQLADASGRFIALLERYAES